MGAGVSCWHSQRLGHTTRLFSSKPDCSSVFFRASEKSPLQKKFVIPCYRWYLRVPPSNPAPEWEFSTLTLPTSCLSKQPGQEEEPHRENIQHVEGTWMLLQKGIQSRQTTNCRPTTATTFVSKSPLVGGCFTILALLLCSWRLGRRG